MVLQYVLNIMLGPICSRCLISWRVVLPEQEIAVNYQITWKWRDLPSHRNLPIHPLQDQPPRTESETQDLRTSRCPRNAIKQYGLREERVVTLGSKPTNSKPRHSIVTNGANCPLASDKYGCGGEAVSNFAKLSRLHVPQRQTKWAVLPFPPLTSRSCYDHWLWLVTRCA